MASKFEIMQNFVEKYFEPREDSKRNTYLLWFSTMDAETANSLKMLSSVLKERDWSIDLILRSIFMSGDDFNIVLLINGDGERFKTFPFIRSSLKELLLLKQYSVGYFSLETYALKDRRRGQVHEVYHSACKLVFKSLDGQKESLFKYVIKYNGSNASNLGSSSNSTSNPGYKKNKPRSGGASLSSRMDRLESAVLNLTDLITELINNRT
jgi:hypothetical protein